jgi:predicted transcriptional regulator
VDEEQKHLQTLEALRDVDEGKVISHEEVEQWFAGLRA